MSFLQFCALFTSSIINDASGKLGGNVFLKTKGGLALRSNAGQTNPNTPLQADVREKLGIIVNKWRGLTDDQQQGWRDIAPAWSYINKVGQVKTYSGYALFMKLNGNLMAKGGPGSRVGEVLDAPPGKPIQTDPDCVASIGYAAGLLTSLEVDWQVAGAATDALVVKVTPPLSAGITNPSKSAYRWIAEQTDLTIPGTIDLLAAYQAKYPTFQAGQKVGIIVELLDTNTGYTTITEQVIMRPE